MRRMLQVRNPRTGEVDTTLPVADHDALAAGCARLRQGQAAWQAAGLEGRIAAMRKMCASGDRRYDAILGALVADTGRHAMSVAEIEGLKGITLMRCDTASAALTAATGVSRGEPTLRFRQQYVPYVLVWIISPWTCPLILSMIDAIPALLAGSAFAIKPSEITPRFIAPFRAAIAEVALLRDVLDLFAGDGATGAELIDLTDMVAFTGSVPKGRKAQKRTASQSEPCFLELGGNDAAVVLGSADAEQATEIIVRSAVENSGQLCCAIKRVNVDAARKDELTEAVVRRMSALRLNTEDPADGDLGPIILDRQARIISDQLADAVAKGATIACGGKVVSHGGGLWCEPTVLTGVTSDMAVMRDETFSPIIPIVSFASTEEAVSMANETSFGLSATVIGAQDEAIRVGEQLNAGGVWINDFDTVGGVGDQAGKTAFGVSGLGGTRYGRGGFMRFPRKQALVIRSAA